MRPLIIGASGLVGSTLYAEAKRLGYEAIGTYLNHPQEELYRLDYGDINEVINFLKRFSPDVIICPAANANVDHIEENPKDGWLNNVEKLSTLFKVSEEKNIPIAFFSSDYIFDGKEGPYKEDSLPNPLNFYGSHKLASEIALKTFLPKNHYIFRTTWVFDYEKQRKNFLYSIINNLGTGKEIKVPTDMSATPGYASDIAKFSLELIKQKKYGNYNLTNGEVISRYDFAKLIAKVYELNEDLIIKANSQSMNYIAKRPLKAGLINDKSIKDTGLIWCTLENAIKETRQKMEKTGQFPLISTNLESKICIYIPCYNATATLPKVFERIPAQVKEKVQEVFVVDNNSSDYTYLMAIGYREKKSDLKNLKIFRNAKNFGYGGSQKLAYAYAIKQGYDMVIMLHGDAQYAPEKLPIMIETMEKDKSIDLLFGSRMTGDPLKGGMPLHRYLGNKALTAFQNMLLGTNISEFHSGYRIFRTSALAKVPFHLCDSYYHFDTEIIILFIKNKLKIGEVTIDTHYGTEKCYVNIWKYGIHVLVATFCYYLYTKGLRNYKLYHDGQTADLNRIFEEFKTEMF